MNFPASNVSSLRRRAPHETLQGLRILLVEDAAADRFYVRRLLGETRAELVETSNLAEALEQLPSGFDCALVDLSLPDAGDLEAVEAVIEADPELAVVALTGRKDNELAVEAIEAGAQDYLVKNDLDGALLVRSIRYAVGRKAHQLTDRREADQLGAMLEIQRRIADAGLDPEGILGVAAESVTELTGVGVTILPPETDHHDHPLRYPVHASDQLMAVFELDPPPDAPPTLVRALEMVLGGLQASVQNAATYAANQALTAELTRRERFLHQVFDRSPIAKGLIDTATGTFVQVNQALIELLELDEVDILGHSPASFAVEEDQPAVAEALGALLEGSEELRTVEVRYHTPSGRMIRGLAVGTTFEDPTTGDRYVLTQIRDITAQRLAEEQLRSREALARGVLDSLEAPTAVIDRDGAILRVNLAWEEFVELTGSDPGVAGLGASYLTGSDAATPEARAAAEGIRSVLWRERDHFSLNYECPTPSGPRWFSMQVEPLRGATAGAVVAHWEITDLVEAQRRLEELVRAKDEFIASVSHELRTPLTAVVGFTDRLLTDPALGEAERREFLELISRQARDVSYIVEDLLVAARDQIDAVQVLAEQVDLPGDTRTLVSDIDLDQSIVLDLPTQPLHALADRQRVRQVIRNLVVNAHRYGGSRVTVRCRGDEREVWVEVIDNGPGIPDEDAERVFASYERAHHRRGLPDSLGLGLSVSRRLAELMGGRLEYERRGGETVFRLTLPRA